MGVAIAVQIAAAAVGLQDSNELARLRVLGNGVAASASYIVALAGAIWAAYGDHWARRAVGGGGRRGVRAQRPPLDAQLPRESFAWLVLLAAAAIGGLALLVLNA